MFAGSLNVDPSVATSKTWCSSNLYIPSDHKKVFEDSSTDPGNWFKPLRKVDCDKLCSSGDGDTVQVEFSRATADKRLGVLRFNYWDQPPKTLVASRWFFLDRDGKRPPQPLDAEDDEACEQVYQRGLEVSACESL